MKAAQTESSGRLVKQPKQKKTPKVNLNVQDGTDAETKSLRKLAMLCDIDPVKLMKMSKPELKAL